MVKLNFRKVASVLTSAVLLSSTIGLAAAANYPAPFVKSGNADVAVVWGSSAQPSDLVAVTDITADLQAELASQTATSGSSSGSSSVSGGDYVKLERSSDKFNLGETMDKFFSSLDSEELSSVLADGVYENDANNEYDYTQKITLGKLLLSHFQDDDLSTKPAIGFDITDGTEVLNYTIDFTPDNVEGGTNFADLETTDLTMLGKSYYVVRAQNVSGSPKLTLLDSANSAIITEGESSTVTVGDKSYDVSINFIDSDEVILAIDGTNTNKLQEGDVFKIADDTYVAVKNILYSAKDAGVSKVEISIGSGKIVLQNGQEVEINNKAVSDIDKYDDATLTAFITNSGENLDKITLTWTTGNDEFLVSGKDLVLPGFETIKLSMGAFNTPMKELTTLENDGEDSIKLSTTVKDGDVNFDLFNTNATQILGYGKSNTKKLVTSSNASLTFNTTTDDWFVASWVNGNDAESYVLEVSDINDNDVTKNTTTVRSVASGSGLSKDLDIGESEDFGRVRLTNTGANKQGKTVTLGISSASGSGTVSLNKLYTKEGLRIQLPYNNTNSGVAGALNLSANPNSWIAQFTEEDEDGNIAAGPSFNITLGITSDGKAQVSSVGKTTFSNVATYETDDGTDDFVGYVNSSLASRVLYKTGADQDTAQVEYHGDESFADVYVSESGAVVSSDGSTDTSASSGTVKRLGSVSVSDADASSVATKNLIVVGGSCVNSVAADLLGGALCGANFESKTGAGAGQFVIQTFARSGGKVATLVAGYNAGDTTNAAKYLTTQTVDTTVGKKYVGTSATSAQLVTQASSAGNSTA